MTPRQCVRALLLSPDSSVLLIRMEVGKGEFWMTPGGGIAEGETHQEALQRELQEEVGLEGATIGPHIWVREAIFTWQGKRIHEREHFYLVRTERFEPDSTNNPVTQERELMAELKWWPVGELPPNSARFAPSRLGELTSRLLQHGVPETPIDTGY